MSEFVVEERKKEVTDGGVKSRKRGRTEKGSECVRDAKKVKDEVKVTGMSVKVDVGFKRQMEAECFDQVSSRPNKPTSCKPQKKKKMQIIMKHKTRNLPIHQVQNQESEITGHDSKAKAKVSNNHTIIQETVKVYTTKRLKNTRTQQQLVRDKIVSMLTKAKWTIEYRPRQQTAYIDAVYVDPKGKTHRSITKAYFSLQKKIKDGKADDKEVSAFTPIPVEEMNVLFRSVSKVRSDKNTKKNVKRGPNISQAEYVIGADSPFKKPPNKKAKDLKKRKEAQNISKVKAKKAKIQHETGVIAESAVQRRPNTSEKDRQKTRKPCLVARTSSKGLAQDNDDCIYTRKRNIVQEVEFTKITYNSVDVMGDDPHDDTCNICGDGGELICCDGCPSTFHQSCLDIQSIPSGDWHCVYCCCKFCGLAACDASHPTPDAEMVKCCSCEEKFHPSCFKEGNELNGNSCGLSFCGRKCQELYERLQTYIGVKFELKDEYSWSLLKRFDLSQDLDFNPMKVECNSRLAVAFSVMDECFVPVIDEISGVNRIHNVVYNCGSNFKRLDYSGFYTAILEKGSEVISVASIRIHDNWLAEMPFIGTRNMYRRQGMCRRLLDAIEGALGSLGVGELVIPAIPELFQTWTKVFGFEPLDEWLRQETKNMSLIVFPGTDMLHKPLFKNEFADENPSPVAGKL